MKKIIVLALAALLAMPAVVAAKSIRGSGNIITKTITLTQEYTKIEASRGVKVEVEERTDNEVIIHANDNIMPFVEFEIDEGELEITIDDDIKSLNNVTVIVSLPANPNLTKVAASSGACVQIQSEINVKVFRAETSSAAQIAFSRANVEQFAVESTSGSSVRGTLKADNGYLEASSAGCIEIDVLSLRCSAKSSSGSKISLEGEVGTLYAEASSAGKVLASDCPVLELVNAKASSGALIRVNSCKKLVAKASSAGSIRYEGEGTVSTEISSGGSIRRM